MKKGITKLLLAIYSVTLLSACSSTKTTPIPRAISTIGTASLEDLNLQPGDYQVINTVEAEATIGYKINKAGNKKSIFDMDNTFLLDCKKDGIGWKYEYNGVVRAGYIGEVFGTTYIDVERPEVIALRLAAYRLINQAKLAGGDGILTPTVQTEVEQNGNIIYFKTKASAKAIKVIAK